MTIITVSENGGVALPANLPKKYNLAPGTQCQIVDYGGTLALIPVAENPIEQTAGLLRGSSSLTNTLLTEHKQELEGE